MSKIAGSSGIMNLLKFKNSVKLMVSKLTATSLIYGKIVKLIKEKITKCFITLSKNKVILNITISAVHVAHSL